MPEAAYVYEQAQKRMLPYRTLRVCESESSSVEMRAIPKIYKTHSSNTKMGTCVKVSAHTPPRLERNNIGATIFRHHVMIVCGSEKLEQIHCLGLGSVCAITLNQEK